MDHTTYVFGLVPAELFQIVTEKEDPVEKIELPDKQINLYPANCEAIWWEEIRMSDGERSYYCQTDEPARMIRTVLEIVRANAYNLEEELKRVNFKDLELFNA